MQASEIKSKFSENATQRFIKIIVIFPIFL